jgi:hypothetical protein
LRRFAATRLLAAGVPVNTVAGRLGHANAATTLNLYGHFLESSDESAAQVPASFLDGPRRRLTADLSRIVLSACEVSAARPVVRARTWGDGPGRAADHARG